MHEPEFRTFMYMYMLVVNNTAQKTDFCGKNALSYRSRFTLHSSFAWSNVSKTTQFSSQFDFR